MQQGLDEIERVTADETVVVSVEDEAEVKMAEAIPVETPLAVAPGVDDSSLYIHRELSQLQFNIRVPEQALDGSCPLLERLKFLLVFSNSPNELLEIRIAGLKKQIIFAREQAGADDLLPHQALARISELVHEQVSRQYRTLNETPLPELAEHQIYFIRRRHWTLKIKTWIRYFFRDEVAPIITPIGFDPTHLFPLPANKSLNFIVELEGMDAFDRGSGLAVILASCLLPRTTKLPKDAGGEGGNYVFLSPIIHVHADDPSPDMRMKGCYQFRLTRSTDPSMDTEDVEDLARALRDELLSRRYEDAVHLEVVDTCPQNLANYLFKQFGLSENELYKVNGLVNLIHLFSVTGLESHLELQYPPSTPTIPCLLQKKGNLLNVLGKLGVLLMHPFEFFAPVTDLLHQTIKNLNMLVIKQTLYRSGTSSETVDALVEVARNDKEVTTIIELRARFDGESSLQLASRLQQAGVVVIYGVIGFKTHTRAILILHREDGELRRYAHPSTGNYHADDARLYADCSLLTADVTSREDLHKLSNQLIGMGKTLCTKKLLHTPFTLKKNPLEMINREAAWAAPGQPTHIMAKVSSLTGPKVIHALYKVNQAGVRIDLTVCDMCCLRPSILGVSHNIHVRSIIGRFFEYSRIYCFLNGGDEKLHLSSANWVGHNLDVCAETCFPAEGKKLVQQVKRELEIYLADSTQAWVLQTDGSYQ